MRLFRRLLLAAIAGALVFGLVAPQGILQAVGRFVVSTDVPQPADAIVVLSGSLPDRILEAVDLYKERFAPRILLVQERSRPGLAELERRGVRLPHAHDLNLEIATQLGVPRAALVLLDGPVNSTLSEADVIVEYLRREQLRSALIVTSKIHSYRAGVIYRWLVADEIDIRSTPSRHDPFDPDRWWLSRGYTRRLIFEYQKLVVFWLGDRWRAARSAPPISQTD